MTTSHGHPMEGTLFIGGTRGPFSPRVIQSVNLGKDGCRSTIVGAKGPHQFALCWECVDYLQHANVTCLMVAVGLWSRPDEYIGCRLNSPARAYARKCHVTRVDAG